MKNRYYISLDFDHLSPEYPHRPETCCHFEKLYVHCWPHLHVLPHENAQDALFSVHNDLMTQIDCMHFFFK